MSYDGPDVGKMLPDSVCTPACDLATMCDSFLIETERIQVKVIGSTCREVLDVPTSSEILDSNCGRM